MTSYVYVPGKHLDVITFEVKHFDGLSVTAVYEALSHRRAATRSFVLAYVPDNKLETLAQIIADIEEECSRHGIGLIICGNPSDYDSWDIREDAEQVIPDPARLDKFIKSQLNQVAKDQIIKWFKT